MFYLPNRREAEADNKSMERTVEAGTCPGFSIIVCVIGEEAGTKQINGIIWVC